MWLSVKTIAKIAKRTINATETKWMRINLSILVRKREAYIVLPNNL